MHFINEYLSCDDDEENIVVSKDVVQTERCSTNCWLIIEYVNFIAVNETHHLYEYIEQQSIQWWYWLRFPVVVFIF